MANLNGFDTNFVGVTDKSGDAVRANSAEPPLVDERNSPVLALAISYQFPSMALLNHTLMLFDFAHPS